MILIFVFGCNFNDKKFDSQKWKSIENGLYGENNRLKMINDLIDIQLSFDDENGTKRESVIDLIGEPDFIDKCDSKYETYIVEEKTGLIDPNGFTYLKLEYNENSILVFWKIEKIRFKE
ncbi:hypothetical protein [Lutibacter oricola]|uniref:hypothetical protein n=1 Tax=Lutibacter oricola TaxID=762486 RepID=UPI0011138B41|nr:hypothetical protein [Lutibacter oricola]